MIGDVWLAAGMLCYMLAMVPAGILGSEELLAIIGNMPLGTLAAFPGLGVTDELVETLVTVVNDRRGEAAPGPRQRL